MQVTQERKDIEGAAQCQPLRLVLRSTGTEMPFGRVLVGSGYIELGRQKPAIPLAVFLGQVLLCADQEHPDPWLRFGDDHSLGGRLYKAFSAGPWPKWADPLLSYRSLEAWPPWRRDHDWLKVKRGNRLRVDGACLSTDGTLAWLDDCRLGDAQLWRILVELVTHPGRGWSVDDLDPRLRARYEPSQATRLTSDALAPAHGTLLDPSPVQHRVEASSPPDLLASPDSGRWLQAIFEREASEMLSTTHVLSRRGLSRFLTGALADPCFREIAGGRDVRLVDDRVTVSPATDIDCVALRRAFERVGRPFQVVVSPAHAGSLLILEYLRNVLQLPISWRIAYGHSVEIAANAARGTFASDVDAFTLTLASAGTLLRQEVQTHRPGVVMPSMSHGLLAPALPSVALPVHDGTYLLMRELPSSELLVYRDLHTRKILRASEVLESEPVETAQALASRDAVLRTVIGFPHYHFNQRYNRCQLLCNPYDEAYIKPVFLFVSTDVLADDRVFCALQYAVREAWLSLAEREETRRVMVARLLKNPRYTTALLRATGVSMLGLKDPDSTMQQRPQGSKPFVVRRCAASAIIGLRHRVLRPGYPQEEVEFEQDTAPDSAHYCAANADDEIIGCVTFLQSTLGESTALQLRAMATDPAWMYRGVGTALLKTAETELGTPKGTLVWCNARLTARGFYERHGWYGISEVFGNGNAGPSVKMMTLLRNQEPR